MKYWPINLVYLAREETRGLEHKPLPRTSMHWPAQYRRLRLFSRGTQNKSSTVELTWKLFRKGKCRADAAAAQDNSRGKRSLFKARLLHTEISPVANFGIETHHIDQTPSVVQQCLQQWSTRRSVMSTRSLQRVWRWVNNPCWTYVVTVDAMLDQITLPDVLGSRRS